MSVLGDLLEYGGAALDKPGRAVRGLLAGDGGEALAALPFSDALGWTDPRNRRSGRDVADTWARMLGTEAPGGPAGEALGFGIELATDPTVWAGVGLGRRLGGKAAEAALARGPRYATSADDLTRMLGGFTATTTDADAAAKAARRVAEWRRSPAAKRILSEIPEDARMIGAGAEGAAFDTRAGDVLRVGRVTPGDAGRPLAEGVLAPRRTVDIGANPATAYRAERVPWATDVGAEATQARLPELQQALARSGLRYGDEAAGNVGMAGGKPVVLDPGALDLAGFAGARAPVVTAGEPGALMNLLLGAVGADRVVRRGRMPDFRRTFGVTGGLGGAGLGAHARLPGEE